MTADVIRRYAALPVPRYTSYPTAAEFSPLVTAWHHAQWLRRLDPAQPLSVYLHVPYCREICHYCGCHTKAARRGSVIAAYIGALQTEIARVAGHIAATPRLTRLHWGGGTPGILGAAGLAAVMETLARHFTIGADLSHAIELDPRHVDRALARALAAMGVNRASLGVQDVEPCVQAAIGRVQPIASVEQAMAHLAACGIAQINIDLIYGLPMQTAETLRRSCAAVTRLGPDRAGPDRIACFGYAHLPGLRANQRLIDATALPGAEARLAQQALVARCLTEAGYQAIGVDHFARPHDPLAIAARTGRLRRNFQGYTDDDSQALIGFGASAISHLPGGYVQNTPDITAYRQSLAAGLLATARGCAVGEGDRQRARIIEALMCNFRVDLKLLDPDSVFSDELALLRPLASDGLLTVIDRVVAMTDIGRPIVRVAAAVFDQFRSDGGGGFSPAV